MGANGNMEREKSLNVVEAYYKYKDWVDINPKIFQVQLTELCLTKEELGKKLLKLSGDSNSYTTSVRVINNTPSLLGFLAWSQQIYGK